MKYIFAFILFVASAQFAYAAKTDSTSAVERPSVLVIPYMPAMHLSDADPDIAAGSEMDMMEIRSALRRSLIKALNKNFTEVSDVRSFSNEFVKEDNRDLDILYHSLMFGSDTVYPVKNPSLYAVKDTTQKNKTSSKQKRDTKYINVEIADQMLVQDFAKKYKADYLIFLNEIDIKTHFDDCINLAMKIYRRDVKVHYSIFDKSGKQIYGDVAISYFGSNTNDVDEIAKENFPGISNYVLQSFNRVAK
jgi:hypothetical protein